MRGMKKLQFCLVAGAEITVESYTHALLPFVSRFRTRETLFARNPIEGEIS